MNIMQEFFTFGFLLNFLSTENFNGREITTPVQVKGSSVSHTKNQHGTYLDMGQEIVETDTVYITNGNYSCLITTRVVCVCYVSMGRPLHHLCKAFASCDLNVIRTKHPDDHGGYEVSTPMENITDPSPVMCGSLLACVIKGDTFIKGFSKALCYQLSPQLQVFPKREVAEDFWLEMDTWYMTMKNYKEMRSGIATEVIIPYSNKLQQLPLTVYAFNASPFVACIMITPFSVEALSIEEYIKSYSFKLVNRQRIEDMASSSGYYTVKCLAPQDQFITNTHYKERATISFYLKFVDVPIVHIEGQSDFTVIFSPVQSSGGFVVEIYSLAEVESVLLVKSEGFIGEVYTTVIYQSEWEIMTKYQVGFPVLDKDTEGSYSVNVQDKDQNVVNQEITLTRAQRLVIQASPPQLEVLDGFLAVFECSVKGNVLDKVEWSRDFESLNPNKYVYGMEESNDPGHRRLKLTFVNVSVNYSGIYTCNASNKFESVVTAVQLTVWPYERMFLITVLAKDQTKPSRVYSNYEPSNDLASVEGITLIPIIIEICFLCACGISFAVVVAVVVFWIVYRFWVLIKKKMEKSKIKISKEYDEEKEEEEEEEEEASHHGWSRQSTTYKGMKYFSVRTSSDHFEEDIESEF